MPAPVREVILAPETSRIAISVEPALNALNSLMMLAWTEEISGLDPWVEKTAAQLSDQEIGRNRLVLMGLYFALVPEHSFPSFPAYLDHLEAMDPIELRDRVLDSYLALPPHDEAYREADKDDVLASEAVFLAFLRSRFPEESIDEPIERQAFKLLAHPERMRSVVVDHLQSMWEKVLEREWKRNEPLIEETVHAFGSLDLSAYSDAELAQQITGKSPEELEKLLHQIAEAKKVVFVPSVHIGPYLSRFIRADVLWILFGARAPEALRQSHAALSRAELLVWLSALADDTRLRMLDFIRDEGETCAQELIEELELSQSTASRHLRQLAASGYLTERRTEAGKCYSINSERFKGTVRALEAFTR
ncbi:MAG: winged helix-turn-helix domain-containing protein [Anaerolineales bacterium]|jgi:DNA-binding transcriptional ArsR family regulator